MISQRPTNQEKSSSSVSSQVLLIAGIVITIHGLNNIPKTSKLVSCLWLLHPRHQTKEVMERVASTCIDNWNSQLSSKEMGLVAVSFDHRNHGSREVDPSANLSWRKGNEHHAIDMFSIIHGTAIDTSLLIDHLGSYIFQEPGSPKISDHFILGVSLGGHSAWQVLMNDERVRTGVIIIGCPDYMNLLSDRARQCGRETVERSFLGSSDFPINLMNIVQKRDPKGIFFGAREVTVNPSEADQKYLRTIFESRLKNKQIFVCSGENDKLVPYHCTEPFLAFLRNAITGWYKGGDFYLENKIYTNVGHTFSDDMLTDSIKFITNYLQDIVRKTSSKV